MAGTLFLIPVPLGPTAPEESLPASVLTTIRPLTHFVVEQAKTARAFLKAVGTEKPLQELLLEELNEHTKADALDRLLAPLRAGLDVGLLSEAGCPAVADPGFCSRKPAAPPWPTPARTSWRWPRRKISASCR